MPKVLLDHPEVLGTFVELTCIAVTDLMGRDSRGGIVLEDVLNRPRRYVLSLLADKKRANDPVTNEPEDICESVIIDKYNADFIAFTPYPDRMLVEINIFDIHVAEFRNPDAGSVNSPHNELVPGVFDGINQAEDLVVLEVFYFLLLDAGAIDSRKGVRRYNSLGIEETVERAEG